MRVRAPDKWPLSARSGNICGSHAMLASRGMQAPTDVASRLADLLQSEHVPKPAGVPGHPKKSTEPARFKSGRGFLGASSRGKAA